MRIGLGCPPDYVTLMGPVTEPVKQVPESRSVYPVPFLLRVSPENVTTPSIADKVVMPPIDDPPGLF